VTSFLRDLPSIRKSTFKPEIVISSFQKTGMWPIDFETARKKLKDYSPPSLPDDEKEPQLPKLLHPPEKYHQVEFQSDFWQTKINEKDIWSDPVTKTQFDAFIYSTKTIVAEGEIVALQNSQFRTRLEAQLNAKIRTRVSLQRHGALTGKEGREMLAKSEKEKVESFRNWRFKTARKERNKITKAWKTRGVSARKEEKARKLRLLEFQRQNRVLGVVIPKELLCPIQDPEELFTEDQLQEELRFALLKYERFQEAPFNYDEFKLEEEHRNSLKKKDGDGDGDGEDEDEDEYDGDITVTTSSYLRDPISTGPIRWITTTDEEISQFVENHDDLKIFD
jgi:hypothetical protein